MSTGSLTDRFRYAPGLDGVRALAVLAVVVYHLGTTGDGEPLLAGGYLGVDVFFVLSGYLITSLLVVEVQQTGRISLLGFYQRRARRLLPAAITVLLAVSVVAVLWLPRHANTLGGDVVAALGYASNWWLIAQDSSYFGGGGPRLLTHLWSLAVEEQFYLVWPLALMAFAAWRASRATILTVLGLAIAASITTAVLLYDPFIDPSRVYYGTDTRAFAPLIGAALAVLVRPWRRRLDPGPSHNRRWAGLDLLGVAALGGLVATAVLLADTEPLLYRGGMVGIAILAAVVVGVAGHPGTWLGRALGGQPLRWLGARSYALYLWHWPVFVLTRPHGDVPLSGWTSAAVRIGLSVALAELSYWLVERPVRQRGFFLGYTSRHTGGRFRLRLPVLRTAALAAVLAVAGTTVGFQLTAAATRSVDDVPRDSGAPVALGPLDLAEAEVGPSIGPSVGPSASQSVQPSPSVKPIPRLAVFGDSQGMTLLVNRPADLGRYFDVTDATIEGCGVLLGKVTSRSGERRDLNTTCGQWKSRWAASAAEIRPRIALVIIGAWDVFDLATTGDPMPFGSAAWDANFTAALKQGTATLRASGATVVLALLPCYRPIKASAGFWPERGDDDRTRHVNALIRAVAAADPTRVKTVEPPSQLCTDPVISTSIKYRWDGVHYFQLGSALYFRAILPQLAKLK